MMGSRDELMFWGCKKKGMKGIRKGWAEEKIRIQKGLGEQTQGEKNKLCRRGGPICPRNGN